LPEFAVLIISPAFNRCLALPFVYLSLFKGAKAGGGVELAEVQQCVLFWASSRPANFCQGLSPKQKPIL
jgi:hypothetical protein